MASITTTIDPARGATVHEVEGEVTLDQVVAKILDYNAGEVALKVVWDFRGGRVPDVTNDEMRRAIRKMVGDVQDLPERRSALVTSNALDFGLLQTGSAFRHGSGILMNPGASIGFYHDQDGSDARRDGSPDRR